MAISKVTQEALSQMANLLQQSVEDIMSAKVEMDGQLRSFIWDDPTGYAFSAKYEEDFKPLTDKLLPSIENYVTYIDSLRETMFEYSDMGLALEMASMAFYSFDKNGKTYVGPDNGPNIVAKDGCHKRANITGYSRAEYCESKWKEKGLTIPGTDEPLTRYNYNKLTKAQLLNALSIGTGSQWRPSKREDEMKPYVNGVGDIAHWNPNEKKIIVHKDFLNDSKATHKDVIVAFFHEDRHSYQDDMDNNGCYDWPRGRRPHYQSVSYDCVMQKISPDSTVKDPNCENQILNYQNQYVERDAVKAQEDAWFFFKPRRRSIK